MIYKENDEDGCRQVFDLMGVPCDFFTDNSIVKQTLKRLVTSGASGFSFAVNGEKMYRVPKSHTLSALARKSSIRVVDGHLAVLAFRFLYGKRVRKIDLPTCALEVANENGWAIGIFGGTPEVIKKSVLNLGQKYPSLRVAGSSHGYLPESELEEIICSTNAELIFLGLGSPKQELLAAKICDRRMGIIICCGGAIDIMSGQVKRAPALVSEWGLEWLYRLLQSPMRIRRQKVLPLVFTSLLCRSLRKNICFSKDP